VSNSAPTRPGRILYIVPLLLLVAAGWFAFGRQLGSANAAEPKTDQHDVRRFREIGGGIVEDTATGLRRPKVGNELSDAFPDANLEPTRDDLRDGRGPRPTHLSIRIVGVETDIVPIGVDENRAIAVPKQADIAGWWSGGHAAGEPGPTVIVGHYDSKVAPGVFENLKKIGVGARIIVEQSDGSIYLYDVTKVEKIAKSEFPTAAVYGSTATSTLRLITCGGVFDNNTHHYVDNTIVYADLAVISTTEVRADRPITRLSELPPLFVPARIVDGGPGELVGPSLPPTDATTTTTTAVASTMSTPVASTTLVSVAPVSTSGPLSTTAPAPPVTVAAAQTTTSSPTLTTTAPTTALPPEATNAMTAPPIVLTSAVPPTVPPTVVGSAPIEAGSPPATSVLP
jgi:LPXTG-site transpeptidase (sortase) family protein